MASFEENAIRIADYLEDRMTEEEELAFMNSLDEDEELRLQYENELLASSLLQPDQSPLSAITQVPIHNVFDVSSPNSGTERSQETIFSPGNPIQSKLSNSMPARIPLLRRYGAVAAAVLILIIGAAAVFIWKNQTTPKPEVAQTPPVPKTGISDSTKQNSSQSKISWDQLYAEYYKKYAGSDEPVELSQFYKDYQEGRYKSVTQATQNDYQVLGSGEKNKELEVRMDFYQGLSFLASGNNSGAIEKFDQVINASGFNEIKYDAKWYLVMANLKLHDSTRVRALLDNVIKQKSPYKDRAVALLQALQ